MLGFYPHLSAAAPRLALVGSAAAAVGGLALIVTTIGAIGLQLTTETGFTRAEENPLFLVRFFLVFGMIFLSFVVFGIANIWTGHPSRLIGGLLLIAGIEPGSPFLFDGVGVDPGKLGAEITLGIAAIAIVAVGDLLRSEGASSPAPPK